MYAIFESGGKQYKANAGAVLNLELMKVPVGEKLELTNVLMVVDGDQTIIGTPTVENAAIVAHVLDYVKGKKITIFKSKKRKGYHRKIGHRQKYMKVQIDEIRTSGESVPA